MRGCVNHVASKSIPDTAKAMQLVGSPYDLSKIDHIRKDIVLEVARPLASPLGGSKSEG